MRHALCFLVLCLAVAGCGQKEPDLVTFGKNIDGGPDEFAIVPTKPLETPPDLASLPTPNPGGANLADPRPTTDAIAALGGNPAALGRPSGDGALIGYAARFGVVPNIRGSLAAEDQAFRNDNRGKLLERVFRITTYYTAYADQALDPHEELERFRAAGVRTPAAPPRPQPGQ